MLSDMCLAVAHVAPNAAEFACAGTCRTMDRPECGTTWPPTVWRPPASAGKRRCAPGSGFGMPGVVRLSDFG